MFNTYTRNLILGVIVCLFACIPLAQAVSTDACYDTDTVLMLHMDGSDTSTTFTDDSGTGHTVTAGGDAQIDTAQKVFGTASGLLDGTTDYLQIASHADFALGTGDFTIDYRIRLSVFAVETELYVWGTSDTSNRFNWHTVGGGRLDVFVGGSAGGSPSFSNTLDTWYHFAITRASGTVRVFVNGDVKDTFTAAGSIAQAAVTIGIYHDLSLFALNGWFDEFRIVKGTAVWTANFTSPSSAYTDCNAIVFIPSMEII